MRLQDGADIMKEDAENENINENDLDTWDEFNKELENR